MSGKEKIKVLVVDDEKVIRDFLTRLLTFEGLDVKIAEDGVRAVEIAQNEKFDLVFLDMRMPRMGGLETFSALKKVNPQLSCVFMTGYALEATLLDKTKQPGTLFLRKPFEDIKQIQDIASKISQKITTADANSSDLDRRAYFRMDIVLEVEYKLKTPQGQEAFRPSLGKDISPGGIRMFVEQDIALGAVLDLVIKIKGDAYPCKAAGEVVWSKNSTERSGYYEVGIKFSQVDYEELTNLFIRANNNFGQRG